MAPLARASSTRICTRSDGGFIDERADLGFRLERVSNFECGGLRGELSAKLIRDRAFHDDSFGGHADLSLVHKSAEIRGGHGCLQIRILEHDHWRLAAQFKKRALEMMPRFFGDDPAHPGRTGKINPAGFRVGNQFVNDFRGIGGRVRDGVDHAIRKTGLVQRFGDREVRARGFLGRFEHDCVSVGERHGNRPHAEDHGGVPGRDSGDDSDGLANCHRERIRQVRRDHFPDESVGLSGSLAQQSGRENAIEHSPSESASHFLGRDAGNFGLTPVKNVRGL